MTTTCAATTRVKRSYVNHTIHCAREDGHDGAHEARTEGRTTLWYGPVQTLPGDTRYRYEKPKPLGANVAGMSSHGHD